MNKTVKNSVIYLAGTICVAVIGFASTMLLTRILSSKVYAMYGLLITFVTAASALIELGYDSSYMRFFYIHGYSQKKYLLMCLKYPLIVCGAFALLLLEPDHRLVKYIFEDNFKISLVLVLIAFVALTMLHHFTQLTARMQEHAINYSVSNISAKSGFLVIVIAVYIITGDVPFTCILVSFFLATIVATAINSIIIYQTRNYICVAEVPVKQKDLFRYGFPFAINRTLILVIPIVEKLIIRDLGGWDLLSIYTAAAIFQTIVLLVTNTIDNIWNPIVYTHCDNATIFKPILHSFGIGISILMAVGLAFCILLRRWLVLLLSSRYFDVYIIAPVILYSSCFNLIMSIYSVGINIRKKTLHLIIAPILQAAVSVTLCYVLIPCLGLIGISIASFSSVLVSQLYRIIIGLRNYDTGTSELKSILLWAVCIAIAILSMFLTSLAADVYLFVLLLIVSILIVNKDMRRIIRSVLDTIIPNKQKKAKQNA